MLKNILSVLLFSVAFVSVSNAQDSSLLMRQPYRLQVAVDKKTVYEEDLAERPYVLPNNTIQLYPGETLLIEITHKDGVIKELKAVKEIADSARTISIKLTQTVNKKTHAMMMLAVTNPFKEKLSYDAMIFLLKQKKWVKTSIIPVVPGLSGFETWPDIFTSIALGNFRFEQ